MTKEITHYYKTSEISLLKDIHRCFAHRRSGKYTTRRREKQILLNIVRDLAALSINVLHLSKLTQKQVRRLIIHWRNQHHKNSTIYHKLAVLGKYYSTYIIYAVLREESIKPSHSKKRVIMPIHTAPATILAKVDDATLHFLLQGQWLFGLTVNEVIHLHPGMFCQSTLTVLARYAFNGRVRYIPIVNAKQKQWIAQYSDAVTSLWSNRLPDTWQRQQRHVLKALNVPANYFRYHYLINRYYDLLSQYHCIGITQQRAVLS